MPKRLITSLLVCLLALSIGCSSDKKEEEAAPAADPFQQLVDAYRKAETPEERVDLCKKFIAENPDGPRTALILGEACRLLIEELDDPTHALRLAASTLELSSDPDVRFDIKKEILTVYAKTGKKEELRALVSELAAEKELGYTDHLAITEATVEAELWDLVFSHSGMCERFATVEAYRADYPKKQISDEDVERSVKRRASWALVYKGRALSRLDRFDEAVTAFTDAKKTTTFSYVGAPETPLYQYWGETLLEQGDADGAMKLLAPEAIMMNDEEALALYEKAYIAKKGRADGFDKHSWTVRNKLARDIEDFTLPRYDGTEFSLSSLEGKVILLTFWFPT